MADVVCSRAEDDDSALVNSVSEMETGRGREGEQIQPVLHLCCTTE